MYNKAIEFLFHDDTVSQQVQVKTFLQRNSNLFRPCTSPLRSSVSALQDYLARVAPPSAAAISDAAAGPETAAAAALSSGPDAGGSSIARNAPGGALSVANANGQSLDPAAAAAKAAISPVDCEMEFRYNS